MLGGFIDRGYTTTPSSMRHATSPLLCKPVPVSVTTAPQYTYTLHVHVESTSKGVLCYRVGVLCVYGGWGYFPQEQLAQRWTIRVA